MKIMLEKFLATNAGILTVLFGGAFLSVGWVFWHPIGIVLSNHLYGLSATNF